MTDPKNEPDVDLENSEYDSFSIPIKSEYIDDDYDY